MRTNKVRDLWNAGGNVVNGWVASASSYTAEVMAAQGFDSVGVDLQHGMIDFDHAIAMLQGISVQEATPLARIPWNDPTWIMKVLDAGAMGLVCPMVNTAEEATHFVQASHYPPLGFRSFANVRGPLYAGSDYKARSRDLVITLAMIETKDALENIEEIFNRAFSKYFRAYGIFPWRFIWINHCKYFFIIINFWYYHMPLVINTIH